MATLTVTETREGPTLSLRMTGDMDSAAFASLELDGVEKIKINFGELGYINSTGIAGWVHWVRGIEMHSPKPQVMLEEVSPFFVRVMMSVKELIPNHWKIDSIVASYFCPKCNQSTARLLTDLSKFAKSPDKEPADLLYHKCSECRAKIELDDFINRYMDVIKRHA